MLALAGARDRRRRRPRAPQPWGSDEAKCGELREGTVRGGEQLLGWGAGCTHPEVRCTHPVIWECPGAISQTRKLLFWNSEKLETVRQGGK